jgi:hypothetical protein
MGGDIAGTLNCGHLVVAEVRLPTERPPAGALPAAEGKTCNPHDRQDDCRDPQQMNRKTRTEQDQYQKSQQKNCHYRSPFLSSGDTDRRPYENHLRLAARLDNHCRDWLLRF